MTRFGHWVTGAALALAPLIGGATPAVAAGPGGGTIDISPKTADGEYDPSLAVFIDAASKALTARGFTILDPAANPAYIAELTLDRADIGTGMGKGPRASAAVVGTGVVVPFSTGQSAVVPLRRTRLELRILMRTDRSLLWNGAAVTVRAGGPGKGADDRVAADLSAALLHEYPAQPEDTVGVP